MYEIGFVWTRRFYLTGDMTSLYPFIQGSLEWPFSELFSANVLLWNQYKYIAFNISSCRILIVLYKNINRYRNELTIKTWINHMEYYTVFSEQDVFCFWDNVHLAKYYLWKYLKIALIIWIAQIKPVYKFPNFRLH